MTGPADGMLTGGEGLKAAAEAAARSELHKQVEAATKKALTEALQASAAGDPLPMASTAPGTWGDAITVAARSALADTLITYVTGEGDEPLCPTVQVWVEHIYVTMFPRRLSGSQTRWCPQWWAHPEALLRLTALWQTWEAARITPSPHAMADWLRTYFDALNPVLLSESGPFASCNTDRHAPAAELPTLAPPVGHWDGIDDTTPSSAAPALALDPSPTGA